MSRAMMQALKTPGLSQAERNIYAYLVGRANGARVCWPLITEIQADLDIRSRHTVCAATGKLAGMGLIKVKRNMRARNDYIILDPAGRLYGDGGPDVQKTAHQNGHDPGAGASENPARSRASPKQSTDLSTKLGKKPSQRALMCNSPHIRATQERAENRTSDVQSAAQESLSKNLTNKEGEEVAIAQFGGVAEPAVPERSPQRAAPAPEDREPTVAEIQAQRAEHAAQMQELVRTAPRVASVLASLGKRMGHKAYALGRPPMLNAQEQIAVVTPPKPRARPLTGAHLAAVRAAAGVRVLAMEGAS